MSLENYSTCFTTLFGELSLSASIVKRQRASPAPRTRLERTPRVHGQRSRKGARGKEGAADVLSRGFAGGRGIDSATARAAGIAKQVGMRADSEGTRGGVDATTALGWNRKVSAHEQAVAMPERSKQVETREHQLQKQAARLQHEQSALNTAFAELHDMNSRYEAKYELMEEAVQELVQKRRAEEEGLAQAVKQRQD